MQLFCDTNREQLKAENPEASFGEVAKLLGAAWKEASADEKATFQEQHAVRMPRQDSLSIHMHSF